MKEEHIEVEGIIAAVLAGTMFRVQLENKHVVLATICGKMRKRWVRLTAGDRVKMEMSPYDLNKGRITWRLRWSVRTTNAGFFRSSRSWPSFSAPAASATTRRRQNQPAPRRA